MEKMKNKVAKAIKNRAEAKVNNEASKLRNAARNFMDELGFKYSPNNKLLAETLRTLADQIEGKEDSWIIPKKIWEAAEHQAFEEFNNQFDALTRFVNQGITFTDGNCARKDDD